MSVWKNCEPREMSRELSESWCRQADLAEDLAAKKSGHEQGS